MDKIHQLKSALADAVHICWEEVDNLEEHGGIIMHQPKTDAYGFVQLRNQNAGTELGPVLWTADRDEYAKHVIPMFKEGWQHYASFHTHPQFYPWPSDEDMNVLFPGFPINYIFSGLTNYVVKYWVQDTANNGQVLAMKPIEL